MCTRGEASHNSQVAVGEGRAQEPLALGRPTCGVGRPQGGPPGAPLWPGDSSMVINFKNMVHDQKFARKDVQIIFPKGLKTQKIFLVFFFVKKRKSARKNSSMRKTILKISNMQWRRTNKVQKNVEKWRKQI